MLKLTQQQVELLHSCFVKIYKTN